MKKEFKTNLGIFVLDDVENPKLSSKFAQGQNPQSDEVNAIEKLITKESIVLDVGAHIGLITIPIAKKTAKVYAFEPAPVNIKFLEENIAKNNLNNVTVFPVAAGSAEGNLHLTQRGEGNTGSITLEQIGSDSDSIQVKTIDSMIEKADFIKIDVEGGEVDALKGAKRIIFESSPDIYFEVNMVELRRHARAPLTSLQNILAGYSFYLPINQGSLLARVPSIWWPLLILSPKTFFFKHPGFVYNFNLLASKKNLPSVSIWHVFSERK